MKLHNGFCEYCDGTGFVLVQGGAEPCDECRGFGMALTEEGMQVFEFVVRIIEWKRGMK